MRYKEPYTLLRVTHKSGLVVFYYRTYDENNKRTSAKSTGCISKTAARAYCNQLFKDGKLIPDKRNDVLFGKFVENWWIPGKCPYLNGLVARGGSFAKSHAAARRYGLEKHLIPFFEKSRLKDITADQIEKWLFSFLERGVGNSTANIHLNQMSIILEEALRLDYISDNPTNKVKPLIHKKKERNILSNQEVQKLLNPEAADKIWANFQVYAASLLASCTGMRIGEIQAISAENIYPDHIHVFKSINRYDGIKDTKTHDIRRIPLPPYMCQVLDRMKAINPEGFLFSNDHGQTAITQLAIVKGLYDAMKKIGIDEAERKERNITFHSWRHFFNTSLRSANISDGKVQKLTGHKSMAMTNNYTHFSVESFQDIAKVQESIVGQAQ